MSLHRSDAGYDVEHSFDGHAALAKLATSEYDLVALDVMLPGPDGLEICRQLRNQSGRMPVLILTTKNRG